MVLRISVARLLSSQKPGESDFCLSSFILYSLLATSKKPPQDRKAVSHILYLFNCHNSANLNQINQSKFKIIHLVKTKLTYFCYERMVQLYNFLFSWQLFPEKGIYNLGERPLSGTYKISYLESLDKIRIEMNWVHLNGQAYSSSFNIQSNGHTHALENNEMADAASLTTIDGKRFDVVLIKENEVFLTVVHEIMPNGYMRISETGKMNTGETYTNQTFYHKQMSVLPYAASVSGAVIRPTEEGVIKHKAITAMEEQTNIQLQQIRQQVELLAIQAQEIQSRKELSMKIYDAKLSFTPVIGQNYYLYEKKDGTNTISLIGPKEWGLSSPFKSCLASVKMLSDHTWIEVK